MTDERRTRPRIEIWMAYLTAGLVVLLLHAALETGITGDELTPNRGATSRVDPRTWLSRRPSVRRAGLRQASLGPEG